MWLSDVSQELPTAACCTDGFWRLWQASTRPQQDTRGALVCLIGSRAAHLKNLEKNPCLQCAWKFHELLSDFSYLSRRTSSISW